LKVSEITKHALLEIEKVIRSLRDSKVVASYYQEFWRRAILLELARKYCPKGSIVVDLGAQPFIVSCALKLMGYEVIAYDYHPDRI